jgi:hypothetical protein
MKEAANRVGVGLGQSAHASRPIPLRAPFAAPFDLDNPLTIYSPRAKSHTPYHSSFATEEQGREGHHFREERVEIVD